ncbi:Serine/threonine protein kinase [Chondromyces apiculatus DSM 436]|uniref:Serine/threonine protein kinase n=2 Tax=Chondromyces apiculatus TaxID=51 RepID=A0A017T2R1_9BACT|nr:Serine/threonine protein kinase [Chondromyces apiculatus DSM 436]
MGAVYRARDLLTGEQVAAKVLLDPSPVHLARFEREAALLSRLSHPGIVRHVAYEAPADGTPYLIMEWLDGEDLAHLLSRRKLSVDETVELAVRVASALETAHTRGIIHRDLKPGNIFLVGGRINQPKILDFGIAQPTGNDRLTGAGSLIGTPGYMAPEQARSGDDIGTPADVFALGCVLFECLTGTRPFQADHVMALLARIIFEEAPRVFMRCPEVPEWLDDLVARMLMKDPARRPADGAALVAELAAQEVVEAPVSFAPVSAITGSERRFLGVVVLGRQTAAPADVTMPDSGAAMPARDLQDIAAMFEARLELLADGTAVFFVSHPTVPTDIAARVARCALALAVYAPGRPMAMTIGWGEIGLGLPVGDAIERAGSLLRRGGKPTGRGPQILCDEGTAALLEARFTVAKTSEGMMALRGERAQDEIWRPLLGKSTPFVGRDHELRLLEQTFASCVEEPMARVVLVTGPAGMGKSRLLQEHIGRLREGVTRGEPPAEVWIGRGDPLRAGSTGGLLAAALRGAAGIRGSEALAVQQTRVQALVARHVATQEQGRVAEFLGELIGVPFDDEESLPLRAARQDPDLLGEQMLRALRDLLRATCAATPLVLILEDVHWADRASVTMVEAVLRELADQPLLVLASARPEVDEIFPQLWAERGRQAMRLGQLSPKAGTRLATQALGEGAEAGLVERVVAQSEGHPFFLEELIRAAAGGQVDALPVSVVAMVQVRLEALDPKVRLVLRAASVMGQVFWRGAVEHLVGSEGAAHVHACLAALVDQEICVRHRQSQFSGEEELAFRQGLLREGAYALLTEEDRALGHRLAAEWLEGAGEADPLVLAAHLERGGFPAQAAMYILRGAELASARQAYLDAERCYERAAEVLEPLPIGAQRGRGLTRFRLGRHRDAVAALRAARETAAAEQEIGAELELLLDEAMVLDWMGEYREAEALVSAAQKRSSRVVSPLLRARLLLGVGRSLHRASHQEDAAAVLRLAVEQAEALGDQGYETHLIAQLLLGFILPMLGRVDEAAQALDEVIARCEARSDLLHLGAALSNRGLVRGYREDREGMVSDFERTVALGRELGQPALELVGRYNLAETLFLMGDLEGADPEVRAVRAMAARSGDLHPPASVVLLWARLRLLQGDEEGALAIAAQVRAAESEAGQALSPSEEVFCAMIELSAGHGTSAAWDALEARSTYCSVGQERVEVLEARGLSAMRRRHRGEAIKHLERALAAAATTPTVMGNRLRRWLSDIVGATTVTSSGRSHRATSTSAAYNR